MPIVVEQKSNFTPMSEGVHQAVISAVKDMGVQPNKFHDPKDPKSKPTVHKVVFTFVNAHGEEAGRFYTPSLHEKSTLAKDLKAITGSVPNTIDLEKLVGTQCQVVVTQETRADGRVRAKISSVLKPAKAQAVKLPGTVVSTTGLEVSDDDLPF